MEASASDEGGSWSVTGMSFFEDSRIAALAILHPAKGGNELKFIK
jgi:hypothetical protein